jgi:hypothetical protein
LLDDEALVDRFGEVSGQPIPKSQRRGDRAPADAVLRMLVLRQLNDSAGAWIPLRHLGKEDACPF